LFAEFKPAVADDFVDWWHALGAGGRILPAMLHISPAMTGIEALDGSGHWETVAGEGAGWGSVWFVDAVPEDWAPYRYGRWRWVPPWGWTWIDDAAWGFAPSHYGRWVRVTGPGSDEGRWGWVPGKPVDNPAYSPAMVAFLGTAGVGLSYPDASGPAFAWFPLAPGEVFRPTFTRDLDAIRQLNAGSVKDPTAIEATIEDNAPVEIVGADYHNRRFATAVPRAAFLAGQPPQSARVQIPESRLEQAPLIADAAPFPPVPTPLAARVVAATPSTTKIATALVAARAAWVARVATAQRAVAVRAIAVVHAAGARTVKTARAVNPRRSPPAPARPQKLAVLAPSHQSAGKTHLAAVSAGGR
jgi:hypothetical protein